MLRYEKWLLIRIWNARTYDGILLSYVEKFVVLSLSLLYFIFPPCLCLEYIYLPPHDETVETTVRNSLKLNSYI